MDTITPQCNTTLVENLTEEGIINTNYSAVHDLTLATNAESEFVFQNNEARKTGNCITLNYQYS